MTVGLVLRGLGCSTATRLEDGLVRRRLLVAEWPVYTTGSFALEGVGSSRVARPYDGIMFGDSLWNQGCPSVQESAW
eukprot:360928-Chlamydomonas_euryale.AAC.4